jgi:serine protease Do
MSHLLTSKYKGTLFAVAGFAMLAAALVTAALPTQAANDKEAQPPAAAIQQANSLSQAFRDTSKKVLPAVVMIQTEKDVTQQASPFGGEDQANPGNPFGGRSPFEDLFKQNPELRKFFQPNAYHPTAGHEVARGLGSGVIIDESGIILTNNHVVAGGGKITVRLHDGREFLATEVKTDPQTDLAIVRIKSDGSLPVAKLGNSDSMEIGDWVLALGQPFGLEGTVTAGIISAKGRGIGITAKENFLQTDAAINPGNSGGPLVDLYGNVIGINTAISSSSGGNQGVGFAVPINLAKWVSDQLVKDGSVHRAQLGVAIQAVTHDIASQLGVDARSGALVSSVLPKSPAEAAGLKSGDVIVEFGGHAISDPRSLQFAVEQAQIGKAQSLVVLRDGKRVELSANLKEAPAEAMTSNGSSQPGSQFQTFGMGVSDLNADVAEKLGLKDSTGVVITSIESGSVAEAAGLEVGNVITQVVRKPVKDVAEFEASMKKQAPEKGVLLLVKSGENSRFVVLKANAS